MLPDCIKEQMQNGPYLLEQERPGNGSNFLGDFWERSEFDFWINSFVEKTLELEKQFHRSFKKIVEDISFFKNKNALSQNYLDKTKWIAPSFFCWSQSLKKSSSSVAPNYKRGNFVKSASCQFRSRQNVSADSEIVFSPVSFSGFSSQHSPPIKGFVWLLIPSSPPPTICPRIWSKPLGKRTKVEWGWWAQAGKVRRQARQKCLQRWQRQKWNQTSRGKVPTKMKLFWRFRHMRTGDQAFGKSS